MFPLNFSSNKSFTKIKKKVAEVVDTCGTLRKEWITKIVVDFYLLPSSSNETMEPELSASGSSRLKASTGLYKTRSLIAVNLWQISSSNSSLSHLTGGTIELLHATLQQPSPQLGNRGM
ncbi:hypothetical protein J6590_052312 [Homalodisca vitripennis]|nr:hypothetical protein J6590_052312 [Homalodisca vitripennis]